MKFEGVDFNVDYFKEKSLSEFIKETSHHMPEEKLAEVWSLMYPEKVIKDGAIDTVNTKAGKNKHTGDSSKSL